MELSLASGKGKHLMTVYFDDTRFMRCDMSAFCRKYTFIRAKNRGDDGIVGLRSPDEKENRTVF